MAVDRRPRVPHVHAHQSAEEEGIDSNQRAGLPGLDMALTEQPRKAFKQACLLLAQFTRTFGGGLFQSQEAILLGEQVMTLSHATPPA